MLQPSELKPQQIACLAAKTPIIIQHGGVGTVKTTGNLLRLWLHINQFPNSVFLIFAQTYDQLERVFMLEWERQIPDYEYKHIKNEKKILLHKSGSVLFLHYAEHTNSVKIMRGMTISGYMMIQAESITEEIFYHEANQRIRLFGKEPRPEYLRLIDANPGNPGHWVHDFFINKQCARYLPDSEVTRIKIRTTAETSVYSEATIEGWRRDMPAWLFERMVNGNWTHAEGRVWDTYTTFPHPANDMKGFAASFDRLIFGCDYGQDHPTAIIFVGFKAGIYYIFDEYVARDKSVRSCLAEVEKRLESWGFDPKMRGRLWVDPSAKGFCKEWNDIPGHGLYAYQSTHKGTDPVLNRAIRIGERLRTQQVIISTLCHTIIQDCERTIWVGNGKDKIDKDTYDPHAMDAFGYCFTQEVR